jgi:rSAM/selenodomain-associated transferase 2
LLHYSFPVCSRPYHRKTWRNGQEQNVKTYIDISVVIPTLNAAATLPSTLATLGAVDVVIADGGSEDGTVMVARLAGARVIEVAKGRGLQLAAGIEAASMPWLLLLHADTRLTPDWRSEAIRHMSRSPEKAAYFRFALDSLDHRARRLERLVAWRCRVLALPYGDQGLLIHRDTLRRVGGMSALPLMEDVDLVSRIGRYRLVGLHASAMTSAVRWQRDGWYRRSCRNLLCLALWRLGVPPSRIARIYQ